MWRSYELHGSIIGVQLPAVAAHSGHWATHLQVAGLHHAGRGALLPDVSVHQLAL